MNPSLSNSGEDSTDDNKAAGFVKLDWGEKPPPFPELDPVGTEVLKEVLDANYVLVKEEELDMTNPVIAESDSSLEEEGIITVPAPPVEPVAASQPVPPPETEERSAHDPLQDRLDKLLNVIEEQANKHEEAMTILRTEIALSHARMDEIQDVLASGQVPDELRDKINRRRAALGMEPFGGHVVPGSEAEVEIEAQSAPPVQVESGRETPKQAAQPPVQVEVMREQLAGASQQAQAQAEGEAKGIDPLDLFLMSAIQGERTNWTALAMFFMLTDKPSVAKLRDSIIDRVLAKKPEESAEGKPKEEAPCGPAKTFEQQVQEFARIGEQLHGVWGKVYDRKVDDVLKSQEIVVGGMRAIADAKKADNLQARRTKTIVDRSKEAMEGAETVLLGPGAKPEGSEPDGGEKQG